MGVVKQIWTLNPYVIKRIPLYILSMPENYLNELLDETRINIILGSNITQKLEMMKLERPYSVYNHPKIYQYMDWKFFVYLLKSKKLKLIWMKGKLYDGMKGKYEFNDEIIQRFKYYMLLLFLSAWKREAEFEFDSETKLVEVWKMEVMQDVIRVENIKMTPYGERDVELKEILEANINSRNKGLIETTSVTTYDTFISQKYQEVTSILGNYNPLLIVTQMLVAPSSDMENFWNDYNDIIPMLFLSKEKGNFRLLNYTKELFDQIK